MLDAREIIGMALLGGRKKKPPTSDTQLFLNVPELLFILGKAKRGRHTLHIRHIVVLGLSRRNAEASQRFVVGSCFGG